jgi:hypothetical protein
MKTTGSTSQWAPFVMLAGVVALASGGCSGAKSSAGGTQPPGEQTDAGEDDANRSDASGSDANGSDANGSDANGSDANGSDANGSDAGSSPDGSAADEGDAGPGCVGVPIVPDAEGSVGVGSNSLGIHGSWFVYSDCTDLHGVNCATVTTPPANSFPNVGGKMCTSGQTSTATGAWGAGIALELKDGPPQQPFDTVTAGIKGFCFQLSGSTIPSTTVRVAFPTKDNNDNAYFEAVSTPGQHTVLFSDVAFAQGSWVTDPMAFEPMLVTLLQFQIPSATTAPVPWDFCVEGLTAVMQ